MDQKAELMQVTSMIRAVCTSQKGGIPLATLSKDYYTLIGQPIPFRKLGYSSLEDMLSSMSNVVRLNRSGPEILIEEVPTEETAHISRLVARQKPEKKAPVRKKFQRVSHIRPKRETPIKITRTITQNVKAPAVNSVTFSDRKKHSFEVPPQFQKLARNPMVKRKKKKDGFESQNGRSAQSSPRSSPILEAVKVELSDYAKKVGLKLESYRTRLFKIKHGVSFYCSTVKIDNHQYSTYPEELKTKDEAECLVASIALKELKLTEKNPVADNTVTSTMLINRVIEIICEKNTGVFNIGVEKEYRNIYNTSLPSGWMSIVSKCSSILIEKVDAKRSILYHKPDEKTRREISPERAPSPPPKVNAQNSKIPIERSNSSSSNISSASVSRSENNISPPPLVLPNEDTVDVFVTHIHSPNDIVVRLADFSNEYEELANDMDMFYLDNQPEAPAIEIHKIYAAKIDESWLRVGVLDLLNCGMKAQIMLLDHGDIEVIMCSALHALEDKFRMLPYQALRCQMYGLEHLVNNNDAYIHIISLCRGKSFVAEIVSRDEPISLILFDTSTDEDININEKLTLLASEKVSPELPKAGGIKEVYLYHVDASGTIYVNIENPYLDLLQSEISSLVEKADNGEGSVMAAQINKMYLAKYDEDDNWYRAHVADNNNEATVKVRFIDFGNVSTIPLTNLRDLDGLSTTLTSLPPQAIACTLHSLPAEGYQWTEKAVEKLVQIAPDDTTLLLKVVSSATPDKLAVVELFKRIKPNNELVSVNTTLLFSMELFKESEMKKVTNNIPSDNETNNNVHSRKLPSPPVPVIDSSDAKISAPEIPIPGEYYDVVVTQAANPFNFTCQPWGAMDALKKLMELMQKYYNSTTVSNDLFELRTGCFYAGKTDDGRWCRIFLHDIINKDPIKVSAYLIDYGDYAFIPSSALQPLNSEFRQLPYMAVKARLYDIQPLHGDWTPMDCIEFQQLVADKEFVSKIKEKSIDASSGLSVYQITVSLIDTSIPGKDTYIERELVEKGIAQRAS